MKKSRSWRNKNVKAAAVKNIKVNTTDPESAFMHWDNKRQGLLIWTTGLETVDRSFTDANQHHGHQYARFRDLMKVRMPCMQVASVQNMKKMAQLAPCYWLVCVLKGLSENRVAGSGS